MYVYYQKKIFTGSFATRFALRELATLNIHMLIRELLIEAAYDSMVDAMRRRFPEQDQMILDHVRWAKQALRRPDRVTWYLRLLQEELKGQVPADMLGTYQWRGLEQLGGEITHFLGYNYAPIDNYVFQRQPVSVVITELEKFEREWRAKQDLERGVDPQENDYKLFEFGDGTAWWWADRAYCSEEGRSGGHCGNVTGQVRPDQRILSLRNAKNQVLLTFILEPDGTLGEMKGRNNQKPSEKYHPQIIKLLAWDRITGIAPTEGQYAPSKNFSIFDLDPQNLEYIDNVKPQLVADQIRLTPLSLIRSASEVIKKKYMNQLPNYLQRLISDPTDENWSRAIRSDESLVINAPPTVPNFEKLVVKYFKDLEGDIVDEESDTYLASQELAQSSDSISKNVDLLRKILAANGYALGGVNRNIREYAKLCEIAVNSHSQAFRMVPDEFKTEKMTKQVAMDHYWALRNIPDRLKSEELYLLAVNSNPEALYFVPKEFQTVKVCIAAVRQDAKFLYDVPEELKSIVAKKLGIPYEDT